MASATADWEKVGDQFYRRIQLYADVFEADLELENYIVSGAPYSGAVALYRDESKIHAYGASQIAKSSIDLYSCAGKLIRQIQWDKGSIVATGWSEDERLLVVTNDGTVRSYTDLSGDFTPFYLGHGAEDYGVEACKFWSTGFVALLGNNNLVAVTRYDEPRPQALAPAPPGEVISWAVIPPEHTSSRSVEVLLAIGRSVYVVDAAECEDRGLQAGPFRHISVSPNGRFIALYTDDGKVWVISSDFQERLSEYDSKARTPPRDLQWCGNNAVVLAWEDEIHLIGPDGKALKYDPYNSFVHLLPDVDGIRILASDVCEFLQKVPDATKDVFRPIPPSPSSILLDALDHLENKSPKADDNIQSIKADLDEAVSTCIQAAGQEYTPQRQKQLLKAASFGKAVLDLYPSDEFVDMTETLRVLNAVRFYEIGLPLSYDQYIRLTPERLIQRLINRDEYLLALKLSEFLHLPVDKIYIAWARAKVRSASTDEETLCAEIVRKLDGKRGISFEEVAQAAYDEGRGNLAVQLLDHEPRAGKQVPLLLSIGEEGPALDKALESGDTDLILHVLLTLKKKMPLSTFFRTLSPRPVATALIESWARGQDPELLKDLYYQDDRLSAGSNLLLSEALSTPSLGPTVDKLKMATKLLRDSKSHTPDITALDETQKLLLLQQTFEKDIPGEPFVGLSVNQTLEKLLRLGHAKRSQKVQTDFKIPDTISAWIRLRALVARRDWSAIEEIVKNKKSPIGFEPYFNALLTAGNASLAAKFIPKCTNLPYTERMAMWEKCGLPAQAAGEAFRAKDKGALEGLRGRGVDVEVERLLGLLSKGR